jgi:hypothetical protein
MLSMIKPEWREIYLQIKNTYVSCRIQLQTAIYALTITRGPSRVVSRGGIKRDSSRWITTTEIRYITAHTHLLAELEGGIYLRVG